MKILKSIGTYFLNILTVLCVMLFALIIAIFAPRHLGTMIVDADKEIRKARKAKKKK